MTTPWLMETTKTRKFTLNLRVKKILRGMKFRMNWSRLHTVKQAGGSSSSSR
jgi:hypothetical protein